MNILPFISHDHQYGRPILIANREQLVALAHDYDTQVTTPHISPESLLCYSTFPMIVTFYHSIPQHVTYGATSSIDCLNYIGTPVPYNRAIYKRQQ